MCIPIVPPGEQKLDDDRSEQNASWVQVHTAELPRVAPLDQRNFDESDA